MEVVKLSREEVAQKYPEVPRLIVLKIDVQRRGVAYADRALARADESLHQMRTPMIFGYRDGTLKPCPFSLLLRDGTSVITDPAPPGGHPYMVDVVDDRLVLTDEGEVLEDVEYWPRPEFYGKKTRRGTPMELVAQGRPQRLTICPYAHCHFWDNGNGCKYCDVLPNLQRQREQGTGMPTRLDPRDISETIHEALKEEGRWTGICLTSGSNPGGKEPFDEEVNLYVETLQAIGENFSTRRFPTQVVGSAFTEKQLARLWEETGLMSYTSDLEVWDERLFEWIVPGKAQWVGRKEWIRRLIAAVEIFGRGNVGCGIVGGVETAQPYGFKTIDEALSSTLEGAEFLASHGVTLVHTVWIVKPGSYFQDQQAPPLEYYVRLARGLHEIRARYGLYVDFDDYRRCGNHPDTDLARLL